MSIFDKSTPPTPNLAKLLFPALAVLTVAFIFSNSLEASTVSSVKSQSVTGGLNQLLDWLRLDISLPDGLVRKLAHLAEFALLGLWLALSLTAATNRVLPHLSWPLLAGLLVPVLDETIQLHVPGRSSQVTDILIDFSGVLLGVLAGLLLHALYRKFRGGTV